MPYVLGHVYLASRLSKNHQFILGNIFPDISHLINRETHAKMIKFAEAYTNLNGNYVFYDGVKNHFRVDGYMHPNFVYKKMIILKGEFNGISDILAHGLIETTMDVEINKKCPFVHPLLRKSLKEFDYYGMPIYLADYLNINRKKMYNIINDGIKVINTKKIYSIRNLFVKGLMLRKYSIGKSFLKGLKIRDTKRLLNTARDIVTEDCFDFLEKTVELTKKKLDVEGKNWYTLKDV